MPETARATLALRYTPPGGPQVTPQFVVNLEYTAQSIGTLDIPQGTTAETDFVVPFGSIDAVKAIGVRNRSGQQLGVRFQEAEADEFSIADGALLFLAMPSDAGDTPLSALTVTTTATHSADGAVDFFVFGDSPTP